MSYTGLTVAKIIQNQEFTDAVQLITTDKNILVESGIATVDPVVQSKVEESGVTGTTLNMPFFEDLTGDDAPLSENDIDIDDIGMGQDVAIIHRRAKGWGVTDLAHDLSGDDPAGRIAARVGNYRNLRRQDVFFATLEGMFAANAEDNDGDLILDITKNANGDDVVGGAEVLHVNTILDAAQLLGDAKGGLVAMAMHSQAETVLNSLSAGKGLYRPKDRDHTLSSFDGLNIVMNDNCFYDPETTETVITLFAAGAVTINNAKEKVPFEIARNAKGSRDELFSRDAYVCHIRGIKWKAAVPTGSSPTNANLKDPTKWERVYEKKLIRACQLRCKLAKLG
jgi:hypothetical protein